MGWAVLYIAFGVVALWLLGEVLLQYKARLRWRLLAFVGFLGVVIGVLIPSVVVIGLGAAAFAVGQTYVTLSFRSGFSAGWAMKAPVMGGSKRRRAERGRQEPTLEVSDLEVADGGYGDEGAAHGRDTAVHGQDDDYDRDDVFTPARSRMRDAETTAVYEPQPMPEDTGSYGFYGDTGYHSGSSHDPYATASEATGQSYAHDYSGYGQQDGYDGTGQQQYAAYSDPYIGTGTYDSTSYDNGYGDHQYYGQQSYGQDQYAGSYGVESPPGGPWVPQQRSTDEYGQELPSEQSYPYQGDGQQPQGHGFDEQYRF